MIALVLLERVLQPPSPRLQLTPHTWRLATLVALLLAAKTWYDDLVFSVDFCDALGLCSLSRINQLEAHMLRLLEYNTAVPMVRARPTQPARAATAPTTPAIRTRHPPPAR